MSTLSPGQIVQMKSGGPQMTVTFVIGAADTNKTLSTVAKQKGYSEGDVFCEWFDEKEKKASLFRVSSLKPV